MDLLFCVQCNNKSSVNTTTNRLVTESCGHIKCMKCLLHENKGCKACLKDKNENDNEEDSNTENPGDKCEEKSTETEKVTNEIETSKADTSHLIKEQDENGKQWYWCSKCKKKLNNRNQVEYHTYCNGLTKPFRCQFQNCDKSFASRSHFTYHMSMHRNERPHTCDTCNASFYQISKLHRHKLTHTKEKAFHCMFPLCKKAFNNYSALRKHGVTHTPERPYECKICGTKLRDQSNYRKHVRKHENRKFTCKICNKEVISHRSLVTHTQSQHEKRSYQCPRCPQAFYSAKDMRRHSAVHSDSKPFHCKICKNKCFRRKDNLERHIRNAHPSCIPAAAMSVDHEALAERLTIVQPETEDKQDSNPELTSLKDLNPLPPLDLTNLSDLNDNEKNTSYILEANNGRESVIFGPTKRDSKSEPQESEYIHKIRKANSMANKDIFLPPMDEGKFRELEKKNNLDVGMLPENIDLYKKILFDRPETDMSKIHWRRKMKLNIN